MFLYTIFAGTGRDRGFAPLDLNALEEMHDPATIMTIDRHGNLGIAGRMSLGSPQDEKIGAELCHSQDAAVHVQVNPNVRGVTVGLCCRCAHEQST
jgi:hypothetical protein